MVDPCTVIGTLGVLLGVLGKAIMAVAKLRDQWRGVDLTILAFRSQLVAIRAALAKLE